MRQYIAEEEPDEEGMLRVRGEKYKHLRAVLRIRVGDMLSVRQKNGALCQMTVSAVDTAAQVITLQKAGKEEAGGGAPRVAIFLFQFIAKPSKMDLIIRQAAECGVSEIIPVEGEFCEKGSVESARKKYDSGRWQSIIKEAREQSGSPVETAIRAPVTLESACAFWRKQSGVKRAAVLWERGDNGEGGIFRALSGPLPDKAALAVGAEGGISPGEVRALRGEGFETVHLETNILRCETAALYGIAVLQTVLGSPPEKG